jgi:hypothetical protein
MSWWKRVLGLDGFDVAVHAAITAILLTWIGVVNNRPDEVVIFSGMTLIASLLVLAVRRRLHLNRQERLHGTETETARLAELEQRLAEVEYDLSRLHELEERLDFAERLLAQRQEPRALEPGERAP